MVVRRKPSIGELANAHAQKGGGAGRGTPSRDVGSVEEFLWNIVSINSDFEEISFVWSQMVGINVHQWMILRAIRDLDRGGGISVKGASAKLRADPSFVATQSKSLEKHGFLRRISS